MQRESSGRLGANGVPAVVSRRTAVQRSAAALGTWFLGRGFLARSQAQPQLDTLPPPAVALIDQYRREFSVPGLQLTYRRGDQVLYQGCFGEADRMTHQPVRPDSLFRIASDSKAFTSAAIFKLREAGKLQLEDRVFAPTGILPQFANLGERRDWLHQITVHQLLTHTAGGWSNDGNDPMFERSGFDHERLIEWTLRTHPLQYAPGTHYAYSNFGYCVLGRVIERLSGQRYPEFVHQEILRPIRIFNMRIGTHEPAPNEVRYYGQGGENPYDFPIFRMDSHGGWIATANDLALFLASLFSPVDQVGSTAILSADSLRLLTTGSAVNPNYACGLAVNREGNAWHTGALPGTTSLMVHTHSKLSWAVVLNTRSPGSEGAARLDRLMWEVAGQVPAWKA
jgi:D-alanyl-D-alanine carboxypeptidase